MAKLILIPERRIDWRLNEKILFASFLSLIMMIQAMDSVVEDSCGLVCA